jgi:hypothetical protein
MQGTPCYVPEIAMEDGTDLDEPLGKTLSINQSGQHMGWSQWGRSWGGCNICSCHGEGHAGHGAGRMTGIQPRGNAVIVLGPMWMNRNDELLYVEPELDMP